MKLFITIALAMTLSACGLESAGGAAAAAKMQVQQAKRGQQTIENVKANLDASMQAARESQRKAEDRDGR